MRSGLARTLQLSKPDMLALVMVPEAQPKLARAL